MQARSPEELAAAVREALDRDGPSLIEVPDRWRFLRDLANPVRTTEWRRAVLIPPEPRCRGAFLDPHDIPARLDELKALRDGWLDGRGIAPAHAGLDWLAGEIKARYPVDLPLPYVYPVAEGGVRLEWSIGSQEVSLEIDLGQRSGEWHALNLDTGEEESRTLNLDDKAAWNGMIDRLTEMVGAAQRD